MDIRFCTIEITRVDRHDVDDEVQVLPNIMVVLDMELKALFGILIKHLPFMVTNEAYVFHVSISFIFDHSQLGESINDNTENDVE